jgi:hypothetical protein
MVKLNDEKNKDALSATYFIGFSKHRQGMDGTTYKLGMVIRQSDFIGGPKIDGPCKKSKSANLVSIISVGCTEKNVKT